MCRQTSDSTCSAAAAATLLRHFEIKSSEGEMAELCRSGHFGTSLHGIYRGLRLKTDGTGRKVISGVGKFEDLGETIRPPAILNVYLDRATAKREPRYVRTGAGRQEGSIPWFSTALQNKGPRSSSVTQDPNEQCGSAPSIETLIIYSYKPSKTLPRASSRR
jgi:hypothetical protein